MKIYVAHSKNSSFEDEIYSPLKSLNLSSKFKLILPHDGEYINYTRDFYKNIDIVIAECSYPATGLGIEIGFFYDDNKDIYCFHKQGTKISGTLRKYATETFEYEDANEFIKIVESIIKKY